MNLYRYILISLSLSYYITNAQVFEGYATHFEGLGTPYGGCGVPAAYVGSVKFVALNVFKGANTGANDPDRPIGPENFEIMGAFKNGLNCGRWVRVTILENCVGGSNSGALGAGFCNEPGTSLQNDQYTGAVQYMIVTDSCGDNNGWCREDPYHLDFHTPSVNTFEKNGQPVNDMFPTHFNNRRISWEFVEAPDYTGDIEIYFMKDSFKWWASIFITNLKNGIHGVQQKVNGSWVNLQMNSDLGQAYLLQNTDIGTFTIRVIDANDNLINNEREYTFDFPETCGTLCENAATQTTYTTSDALSIPSYQQQTQNLVNISTPNPFYEEIKLENLQNKSWVLMNALGKIVLKGKHTKIDTRDLSTGLYIMRVEDQILKLVKK